MFIRADLQNRECIKICKTQGHADGFHVRGRNNGDHCVCLDSDGRNVERKNQDSIQEK